MSTSSPHPNPLVEPFKVEAETIHAAPDASSLPVSSSGAPVEGPSPSRASSSDASTSRPSPIEYRPPPTSGRPSISTTHVDSEGEVGVDQAESDEHGKPRGKKVEEVKHKKEEVVLQDQTNLLPVRQVSARQPPGQHLHQ